MPTIQKKQRVPRQLNPPENIARFSVSCYHEMIAGGIFGEDDRLELINGWIVDKMTINPQHANCVRTLNRLLGRIFTDDAWVVGCQDPITLTTSEPEPDLFIAIGLGKKYRDTHPTPKDVALVIEIADTSLVFDQTIKLMMYAAAKIPQYWVVNLLEKRVEVFTLPRGGQNPTYKMQQNYAIETDVPLVLRGQELGSLPVREFLL